MPRFEDPEECIQTEKARQILELLPDGKVVEDRVQAQSH